MSRLSMFTLMTALVAGSAYAALPRGPRGIETPSQSCGTQPAETEPSLEAIEKRSAIAEARRTVGSQLRDNS